MGGVSFLAARISRRGVRAHAPVRGRIPLAMPVRADPQPHEPSKKEETMYVVERPSNRRAVLPIYLSAAFLILALMMSPGAAKGQWQTCGTNNICNTNPGNVGVGTSSSPTTTFQVTQATAGVGTVSTTAGGTTVTGVGTQFSNTFKVGDTITANGETRTISAISSDTSLTTDAWTNTNSGVAYTLVGGARFSVLGNGFVGIGTTTPTAGLHVRGMNSYGSGTFIASAVTGQQTVANASGSYIGHQVAPNFSASSGHLSSLYGVTGQPGNQGAGIVDYMFGVDAAPSNLSTGSVGTMVGSYNAPANWGTGPVTYMVGDDIVPGNGSTGTITILYGSLIQLQNNGGGTVSNGYSLYIGTPSKSASATYTNNYGVFIQDQSAIGSTAAYNFYSQGVNSKNYFEGKVGIGTVPSSYKLDVAGQVRSSSGGFVFPDGTVQLTASPGGTITGVVAGTGMTGGGTSGSVTVTNSDPGSSQSIFKNVANSAGATQFSAGSNSDTIRFEGTGGTSVSFDAATKKVTINGASPVTYGSTAGTAVQGNTTLTVSAGSGLSGGGTATLGAGGTLTLTNADPGSSQSIFKNVANAAGAAQFSAGSNNDTLRFEGTGGTSVSFDAATKKVTINSSAASSSGWTDGGSSVNLTNASANVGVGVTNPSARLQVVGANGPADNTASPAPTALSVTGGTGGNGTWGASAGGAGGDISLTGGVGGVPVAGGSSATGGAGGAVTITGGTGGTSAYAPSGVGGNVVINGGASGNSTPTGPAGNVVLANLRGNVGIGTATPSTSLEVTRAMAGNFNGLFVYNSSAAPYNSADSVSLSLGRSQTNVMAQLTSSNKVNGTFGDGYLAFSTRRADVVSERMRIDESGNVSIGTPSTSYKLDVNGTAHVAGDMTVDGNVAAKYQDVAEWVPSSQKLSAGTVVVLDTAQTNHVLASKKAYDTGVAGVVSDNPGVILGQGGADKVKVATTGRVKVRVDATRAPIHVGDLLVTSEAEGVAMKSIPVDLGGTQIHRPGTIIGKALEPLEKGTGEILVLLSLQ
jgi:fibronectin-binding autotransporter adhesin